MFSQARIKLTLWYLLIISLITIAFSLGIYKILTLELDRVVRIQRFRIESPNGIPFTIRESQPGVDNQLIEEVEQRVRLTLLIIDLGILAASAFAAYFLAGKTLGPIEKMVEEQKRFVADASHELRTPITALKSEIEVSLRDKKLSLNESKKLLRSNLEEVNKLQTLSDYLLTLSRYQTSDFALKLENIKLSPVVNEAIKRVSYLAEPRGIEIKASFREISFSGNNHNLVELLVILLDNAVKFSSKGKNVNLKAQTDDGHLIIEVSDQGAGISEKDLPFIFNRFYQADSSRTKDRKGYGLGLAIAKRIVELHQGSIDVTSKFGEGTTFKISLPLKHGPSFISAVSQKKLLN